MLIAGLLVGLIAAVYFGSRAGLIAGGLVVGLFALSKVVPGLTVLCYVVVGAGVARLCWVVATKPVPRGLPTQARTWGTKLWQLIQSKTGK